jgi:hypothetical protein
MVTETRVLTGFNTVAAGLTTTVLNPARTVHFVTADAGGDIFTLAAGTVGQEVYIFTNSATGIATITPADLIGGTSITFNAAGDSVCLKYLPLSASTNAWVITGGNSYAIV